MADCGVREIAPSGCPAPPGRQFRPTAAHSGARCWPIAGAHQGPAPMRWRAGQMGDAIAAQAAAGNRRWILRHRTRSARHRPAPPAGKSASRHSGECHKMCPRSRPHSPALIAPVRASSVCATIFGAPVVPEVNITHSLARVAGAKVPDWSVAGDSDQSQSADRIAVRHQRVDPRAVDHIFEMIFRQVGRRDHDAAGDRRPARSMPVPRRTGSACGAEHARLPATSRATESGLPAASAPNSDNGVARAQDTRSRPASDASANQAAASS